MMIRNSTLLCALAAMLVVGAGSARAVTTTIYLDDFESYTSTAQMNAVGAWGDNGSTTAGTLMTSGGNSGQYMDHPAGNDAQHAFANVTPSNTNPIIWSFDFLDDGVGNKRVTGGLRDNAASSLLEMGRYNSVSDPESASTVSGYANRNVFVGGSPGNWITYNGNPSVQTGWHTFTATIYGSHILFELDFDANGTVDANRVITTSTGGSEIYNALRLGGPSNLSSPGGGAGFDNVFLGQGQPAGNAIDGLKNTGLSVSGATLPGNVIDPHWSVHQVASAGAAPSMTIGSEAYAVPVDGFPIPPWIGANATSAWISSAPDDGNAPQGFFDYVYFLELEGTTALIEGQWSADNAGVEIFVNGNATGNTNGGFGGFTPFVLGPQSGFVNGLNVLTFRIENFPSSNNPAGLRVEFTNFQDLTIPEPATLSLAAMGLFALARRRNRNEHGGLART